MATRNINLTDTLDRFVAEQVASGQFQNASEVVRAGLRALKAEQAAHAAKDHERVYSLRFPHGSMDIARHASATIRLHL